MRYLFIVFLSTFLSLMTMAQQRPEVGRYSKVYTNGENLTVTITRVGSGEQHEVLVLINGADHSWDQKIFKAKANTATGQSRDFTTTWKGKNYTILSWKDGYYTLYLPMENIMENVQNPLKYQGVAFDNTPDRLLTAYLEQQ